MKTAPRFFALLVSLVAAFPLTAAESATVAPPQARLGSNIFRWEDLAVKTTSVGERRDVCDQPTATLARFESHVTTLNPGKISHSPHKHPQEEFIILKEGMVDVSINGQVQRAGPGSLFFFASNDLHNLACVGDKPATYIVFNVTTGATAAAPTEGAAKAVLPGRLSSRVVDWEKLEAKPTKTGERREVLNSPTVTCANLECHVTTLKPGEIPHAPHRHADEEIVIVKEGVMEATINGVSQRGGPGSIFFYGSNDEHGMKNVGGTTATYHVVRIVTDATPKA
jgi:quercetin dioxygenase-like cupin family protein